MMTEAAALSGGLNHRFSTGAKVGIVFGALSGLALLVGAFILLRLKKRQAGKEAYKRHVFNKFAFAETASTRNDERKEMDFVSHPSRRT